MAAHVTLIGQLHNQTGFIIHFWNDSTQKPIRAILKLIHILQILDLCDVFSISALVISIRWHQR